MQYHVSFDHYIYSESIISQIHCFVSYLSMCALQWHHNELDGVSNHQPCHCFLSHLFGRRSKKTSKLRVTGLCVGNSPGTGEFPAQMASNAENVSIWWCHHGRITVWLIMILTCSSQESLHSAPLLIHSCSICWTHLLIYVSYIH